MRNRTEEKAELTQQRTINISVCLSPSLFLFLCLSTTLSSLAQRAAMSVAFSIKIWLSHTYTTATTTKSNNNNNN